MPLPSDLDSITVTGSYPSIDGEPNPVPCGTSSTGQTAPPSTGTTMASLTGVSSTFMYGYTS